MAEGAGDLEEAQDEEWKGFSDSEEQNESTADLDDQASASPPSPPPAAQDPKPKKQKQKKQKAEKPAKNEGGDDVNPFALLEEDQDGMIMELQFFLSVD